MNSQKIWYVPRTAVCVWNHRQYWILLLLGLFLPTYTYLCVCAPSLSHVQLFVTPWTVDHHAPLSTGFSKQEYWSDLPFTSPGDLSHPWIEPMSLESPALAGRLFSRCATWEVSSWGQFIDSDSTKLGFSQNAFFSWFSFSSLSSHPNLAYFLIGG